jgi:chemosensory pili system protein ChpA (sensor histidine kinase/response regulator)
MEGFNDALAKLAGASEKLGAPELATLLRELGQAASASMTGDRSDQFSLEMAEAMLFVEHGLDQVRQLPEDFGQHAEAVGQRLLALAHGDTPPDAPAWQGEMARELQQGQTVAVLAGEIRTGLRQVEKLIDDYYEDPARSDSLEQVDPLLHQLQGALAILDQEQATQAVDHVRARVRTLLDGRIDGNLDAATRGAVLDNLARNIGALGFFTDALAQNVDGARRRYRFDAAAGLFHELPLEGQAPAEPAPPVEIGQAPDAVDAELLEIFIGEAREVLDVVAGALPVARANPADQDTLTRLRRGFHTLKGSSRMVNLERFAAAAAAIEKVMNVWLAEARAATPDLLALLAHAHAELAAWVDEQADGGSRRDGVALVQAALRVQEGGTFALPETPGPIVSAPDVPVVDAPAELAPETVGAFDAAAAAELADDAAPSAPTPDQGGPAAGFDVAPDEAPAPLPALSPAELPDNVLAFPVSEANVRHVGDLEIPLPLYNIYLGETEELVRSLAATSPAGARNRCAPGRRRR